MTGRTALPVQAPFFTLRIGSCEVQGHFFDLDSDRDISLAIAYKMLRSDETARADRFKFDLHRDRFARGRAFLRRALAQDLGEPDPRALEFEFGPQGKPSLAGTGLYFNLSHCENTAVLVKSEDGPLGVDIERHDRETDILALAPSVFTGAECQVLRRQTDDTSRRQLFFDFWTAKEARMKLTGEGMSLNPKEIFLDLVADIPIGCAQPRSPRVAFAYVTGLVGQSCAVACLGDAIARI